MKNMNKKNAKKKNEIRDGTGSIEMVTCAEIEEIARVYTAEANKDWPNQWQDLPNGYERYKGAMLRHLCEVEKGNDIDKETGCYHIAQVAWNAIAMLHFKLKEYENEL